MRQGTARLPSIPTLAAALALALLGAAPLHAQAAADSAWRAGDMDLAQRLYARRLAADSSDPVALHRMGLMLAWKKHYDASLALFARLTRLQPANVDARVDRARVLAWRGQVQPAIDSLNAVLRAHPKSVPALEARAQFESWAGRYGQALSTYNRVLELAPGARNVNYDRARILTWANRYGAATAVYDSLLAANPRDVKALLGLGQMLGWAGRLDSARVVYDRVLRIDAHNADALRGQAQVAAWGGHLVRAERLWRQALRVNPGDGAALVGLSQTLRWEGRPAAALKPARRALRLEPTSRGTRDALRQVGLMLAPRTAPSVVRESDSDGNAIVTTSLTAAWHPAPRLELRADAYLRNARDRVRHRSAEGGTISLTAEISPGWHVTGTLGASGGDRVGGGAVGSYGATISTPGRYPVGATLSLSRSALDATALLIDRAVVIREWALSVHATPAPGWTVSAGGSTAHFAGGVSGQSNRRAAAIASVKRRFGRLLSLGAQVRGFGYRRHLSDGYFDPDFFGVAEVVADLSRDLGHWSLGAEVAPGVQQVGRDGAPAGAFRASGSLYYVLGSGQRVGVTGTFANLGLQQLSPTAGSAYRYAALGLKASWTF